MQKVAYLCDGKACKDCNSFSKYCTHTTDVAHAVNFDEVGNDRYMEVPASFGIALKPEAFKNRMLLLSSMDDEEEMHKLMDDVMCDVLRSLGYGEGVQIFLDTPKWWA